ncbi:unnamed protein product [Rotaria sp. Silwood1]|nr:unnamed protein product [Rotaria sp. Silwood1]
MVPLHFYQLSTSSDLISSSISHVRIMFDEFHNITTKPSEKSRRSSLTGQDKISSIKLDNSCWRKSKQSPS